MAGRKGTSRAKARGRNYAGGMRSSVTGQTISAWAFKGGGGKVIGDHLALTVVPLNRQYDTPTGRVTKARRAINRNKGRK